VSKKDTKGPFDVSGYDSFSRESFPVGRYPTLEEAIAVANAKGGQMTLMYVTGPDGKQLHKAGSF
jgi:hypothetical protein